MAGFTTRAIHNKYLKEDAHRSLRFPIYSSVAYEFETAEEIEKAFLGEIPSHLYSRITNPTVENFEQKIKNVTDSLAVVALSSGMAAISNLILSIAGSGDNIITTKFLFGNTYSLFEKTLKPWGLEAQYTDMTDPNKVEASINKNTKAIFLETITNPQLEVADIKAISKIAKKKGILTIADTTITPPYLFRSKDFGVDIEILSSTKYISGGATSVGGLIIDNGTFDWENNENLKGEAKKYGPFTLLKKLKRESYRNLGACLSPNSAYLQSLGLETLAIRADRSCANALSMARYLESNKKTRDVNYPGLENSTCYQIASAQFPNGAGGLLTFDLGSKEECFNFINRLRIIRRATNLNDNKSLILHPASTIFCEYAPKLRGEMGVRETMIRLAVGIEDIEDLINDIEYGLEGIQ